MKNPAMPHISLVLPDRHGLEADLQIAKKVTKPRCRVESSEQFTITPWRQKEHGQPLA